MNNIINLTEVKKLIEKDKKRKERKKKALGKLTKKNRKDIVKFNHDFYKLVDMFLEETYPEAFWRFDVWLDEIDSGRD